MSVPSLWLAKAGAWFLESGIQDPDGGVSRYRLNSENRNLPVSTEITGYAASTYAYLHHRTGDPRYLDAARQTARFLSVRAWNAELQTFPFELGPGSPSYFFDCGIIIRGLLSVWRLTKEEELLRVAEAAGRSMARDFLTPTSIHPVVSLPDRVPWPYEKRWSREPGCFQLKSALAWRDLADITGDSGFLSFWTRAFEMALANDPAFLPGTDEPLKVMDRLHAYCYYMEASLAERSVRLPAAIERTAGYLREIAPRFSRSDVWAQLLRVRLLAHQLEIAPLNRAAAEEEARKAATFQYENTGDRTLEGGFCFGRREGALLPFVNPVSTGFCLQALDMWESFQTGRPLAGLCWLI